MYQIQPNKFNRFTLSGSLIKIQTQTEWIFGRNLSQQQFGLIFKFSISSKQADPPVLPRLLSYSYLALSPVCTLLTPGFQLSPESQFPFGSQFLKSLGSQTRVPPCPLISNNAGRDLERPEALPPPRCWTLPVAPAHSAGRSSLSSSLVLNPEDSTQIFSVTSQKTGVTVSSVNNHSTFLKFHLRNKHV